MTRERLRKRIGFLVRDLNRVWEGTGDYRYAELADLAQQLAVKWDWLHHDREGEDTQPLVEPWSGPVL